MGVFLSDQDNREQVYGGQPLLVMVVDGQDAFRRRIRDILHGMGGFQVVAEAASCHTVLETVERLQVDLVIVALSPEDTDCIAFTLQLKHLELAPHVVIFSSAMHDALLMQLILAGADGYLLKDTPTRDIIRAFKHFERGGPAMLPAVATSVIHLLAERCLAFPAIPATPQESIAEFSGVLPVISERETSLSPGPDQPVHLSRQEQNVFTLLRQGLSNKQIAGQLAISPYTVGKHVQNILRKLGAVNRTQAAAYTSFEGYSSDPEVE
jgi:DNA-binding NarL/FixJ family response regulator